MHITEQMYKIYYKEHDPKTYFFVIEALKWNIQPSLKLLATALNIHNISYSLIGISVAA